MSAKGVPLKEARCGKWMRRAQAPCGLPENHGGRCRTARAMANSYARNVARHARVVGENQAWVDSYKLRRGCIDCGYAEHPVALDFDHRDPEMKTAEVSALLSSTRERIQSELDKCEVRCANCHRIKTLRMHQSRNRRRPAPSVAENGPDDEITDHLQGRSASGSSAPPPW